MKNPEQVAVFLAAAAARRQAQARFADVRAAFFAPAGAAPPPTLPELLAAMSAAAATEAAARELFVRLTPAERQAVPPADRPPTRVVFSAGVRPVEHGPPTDNVNATGPC